MNPEGSPARRTAADRLLGLIGGAMVLLAAVLLVRACTTPGARDGAAATVPAIRLLEATAGAPGEGLAVVFQTDAPLRRGPAGWEADTLHLHAELGGRMVMSDVGRVEPLEGDRYRWVIPPPVAVPGGEPSLVLYWADASHRRVATGATEPVRVRAR